MAYEDILKAVTPTESMAESLARNTGYPALHMSTNSARLVHVMPPGALVLAVISAVASIGGSALIFWTFARFKEIRNRIRWLLLFLTIADFMIAVGNLTGTIRYMVLYSNGVHVSVNGTTECNHGHVLCVTQSFWTTYSSISSFFWTTAIAVFLYVSLFSERPTAKVLPVFHIICWGVPGVICVIAVSLGALGEDCSDYSVSSGSWCWINGDLSDSQRTIWMICAGKAWEILTYLLSAMLIVILLCHWRLQPRQSIFDTANKKGANFREEDRSFFFVPLVLYLLRMWGTIRFFIAIFADDGENVNLTAFESVLLYMQCIGDNGQAFCNSVLFCLLDKTVRKLICSCCYRETQNSIQASNGGPGYGAMETQFLTS